MLLPNFFKLFSFSYDVTIEGGTVGTHTEPGLIFSPRTFCLGGFGVVDIAFTGLPTGSYGIGLVGSPGLFLSVTDFTLLPAGTPIGLNQAWMPNGGVIANDIANFPGVTGKVTCSFILMQLP